MIQVVGKALARLNEVGRLVAERQYDIAADEVCSRLLPPRNSFANWDRFVVLALDPARPRRARPTSLPERASPADIDRLCDQFPKHAPLFRRRVADGHECYVYRDGDRIVARQWLIPERPAFDTNSGWTFVPPVRPAVWVHDLYIDQAYRLRGYFVGFMENAVRPRDGVSPHVYAEVHFRNKASLQSCTRYGFAVEKQVTAWTCMGVRTFVAQRPEGGEREVSRRYGFAVPPRL